MKSLKPAAILILGIVSQGCVGVAVLRSTRVTISDPAIGDVAGFDAVSRGNTQNDHPNPDYAAQWLEAHWGKPTTISAESGGDGSQIWTYKFDSAWRGAIPMLIVPIPLVLPTASEKVVFVVRESRIVSVGRVESRFSGAGAGLLGPDGFGAWAGIWDEHPK